MDVIILGPCPGAFGEGVVVVTRRHESRVTIAQIATDLGIGEAMLRNWLREADMEEDNRPGRAVAYPS